MGDVKTAKKSKGKAKAGKKAGKKPVKVTVPKIPKLKSKHAKALDGIGAEMVSIANDANAEANRTVIVSRLWGLARMIGEVATEISTAK